MKQPEPIDINIPVKVVDGVRSIMYSMMPVDALMKLRTFLDELIKWKAAGNPVEIMTLTYQVRPISNSNDGGLGE